MSTPLHGSEKNEHHACTELLIGATSASLVRIRVYSLVGNFLNYKVWLVQQKGTTEDRDPLNIVS
uniref:Uncharacterized protein n=1 Tax=Setaria italica TaxID=4555 RepID=K3XP28_SETIT